MVLAYAGRVGRCRFYKSLALVVRLFFAQKIPVNLIYLNGLCVKKLNCMFIFGSFKMKEEIDIPQISRCKCLFLLLLLLVASISKGKDTLSVNAFISNSVLCDSTGLLTVLKQNNKAVLNPVFFAQTIGGLRLPLSPQFTLSKWYDDAVLVKLEKDNVILSDSSVTQVNYLYGLNGSHEFLANYSDKLGETYINLIFDRTASESKFVNSDNKNVGFLVNFLKNEGKFRNHYGFSKNNFSLGQNGGLSDSASYIEALELTKFTVPVFLSTAQNSIAMTDAHIGHQLVLNYKDVLDTTQIDTLMPKYLHSIGYGLNLQKEQYVYSMDEMDSDSAFFDTTFVNLSETWDSLGFYRVGYEVYYQLMDSVNRNLFKVSYSSSRNDWAALDKSFLSVKFNNYLIGRLSLSGSYNVDGLWREGYSAHASHDHTVFNSWISSLKYDFDYNLPGYFYMNYKGNHFNWSKSYEKVSNQSINYSIYNKPTFTGVEGKVAILDNWIYMDTVSLPTQLKEQIQYLNLSIFNTVQSKYFSIYTKFSYQKSNSEVLRFPVYNFSNIFTYNFRLCRLKFTTGYQFNYFAKFTGLDYNPNLRRTYLQNTVQVGGIPLLDVFATVSIGEANVFVKGENILFESVSRAYFLYPNRPVLPRYIRVGFSWTFNN
jgi:hypothetical protein